MKVHICVIAIMFVLGLGKRAEAAETVNIIPYPDKVQLREGFFVVTPKTRILVSTDAKNIGVYLRNLLKSATGYDLSVRTTEKVSKTSNNILLTLEKANKALGDEGYELVVSRESVTVRANAPAGLFYGIQTLRQLLPPEIESQTEIADTNWTLPCLVITDKPRFEWRGMHLDVGRHMFPVDFIKKYIDLLAMHKMNTFHWHLTEDQGWRIEIKKHPKLTEVGSKRSATPIPADRRRLDGKPYGGFYSQEEIKEIVAYAAERFITVIPEIELPGHSVAALASYPHLGCTGGPYSVRENWGVAKDVYCAGNEQVYKFLEEVLSEVVDLFPSRYIHIGGDECRKDRWKACSKCQAMIKKEGLQNEHELQSYFIKRIEKFLDMKGRRIMGWDEILEGGLAPKATVMCWRGTRGGVKAIKMGHDVVMSPTSHCYFDYYQAKDRKQEPPAIGGFLPLDKVYSFDPVPKGISPEMVKHVLGGQGNLWTEFIPNSRKVEYMAFPRASALAEVLWSAPESRDYGKFMERLSFLLKRFKLLDVNFRDPEKGKRIQQKNVPDK